MSNSEEKKFPATKAFLFFEGIKGPITEEGHEGWFEINSFQWGMGLGISSAGRRRRYNGSDDDEDEPEVDDTVYADREASEPSVSEITISKTATKESPLILFYSTARKSFSKVYIELVKYEKEGDKGLLLLKYVLFATMISGFSTSWASGEPNESVSLNYGGYETITYDEKGKPAYSIHYHLGAGTATSKAGENLDVIDTARRPKKEKKKKEEPKTEEKKEEAGKEEQPAESTSSETQA